MPLRLIVNADDFGLTRGINQAIAELHDAGALTSATLMAAGPAFDDAVSLAKARPTLGVGCHIVLIDGTPLSPPETIPSLLGPDRRNLRSSLPAFAFAALTGRIRAEDVQREALAQIQHLQRAGINITHVDTHKHTHIFPAIARPLLRLLEQTSIGCIRNPFEPAWATAVGRNRTRRFLLRSLRPLASRFLSLPQIRQAQILTTEGTVGVAATGDLNPTSLCHLIQTLPDGVWELVCHPGYNDPDLHRITTRLRESRNIERRALLAVFGELASRRVAELANRQSADHPASRDHHELSHSSPQPPPPELIHYGNLAADPYPPR